MIDLDIYRPNQYVEEFLESLRVRLKKDYAPIKVYISTASHDNHWIQNLYTFYNEKEEKDG